MRYVVEKIIPPNILEGASPRVSLYLEGRHIVAFDGDPTLKQVIAKVSRGRRLAEGETIYLDKKQTLEFYKKG